MLPVSLERVIVDPIKPLEIGQNVDRGHSAKFFCSQSAAAGAEGGIYDVFEHLSQYDFQVFECFSLFFLDFLFVLFCSFSLSLLFLSQGFYSTPLVPRGLSILYSIRGQRPLSTGCIRGGRTEGT